MADRNDPSGAFRFEVEIDGINVGSFSEVRGLEAEIEVEVYREGGSNFDHVLKKREKYPPLVLRRGFTNNSELWNWYSDFLQGKNKAALGKTGSIILLDPIGAETCRWNFFGAYPIRWTGPNLNANSSEIAIESVEIVHRGLKQQITKR
ncbi:MAG: phage tail protein [Solirubrobacterales bacterium]